MLFQKLIAISVLAAGCAACTWASPMVFSGSFLTDDEVALIPFAVFNPGVITIQTTSFADGSVGFEPVIALYDGAGDLLWVDQGGTVPAGCGARAVDAVSGACLDGYIQALLTPGSYTVALTQYDNIPSGPTLGDGFPQAGQGNFTGPNFLGVPGSFILYDGSQRNSNWALVIDGTSATVPEPGTTGLAGFCLVVLYFGRRWRRRQRTA